MTTHYRSLYFQHDPVGVVNCSNRRKMNGKKCIGIPIIAPRIGPPSDYIEKFHLISHHLKAMI